MIVCPECHGELRDDASCKFCGFVPGKIDGFVAFAPQLATANDNYDAAFHEKLFQLEDKCFWFSERNKLLIWAIKKFFPRPNHF